MKKLKLIGTISVAVAVVASVGVSALMQTEAQDQPAQSEPYEVQVAKHESNVPKVVITPSPAPVAEPVSEHASPAAPSPAPAASVAPVLNTIDDILNYFAIPANEQHLAKIMTAPTSCQRAGIALSDECRASYVEVVRCLNDYVKGKYGNWTAAKAAQSADPSGRW